MSPGSCHSAGVAFLFNQMNSNIITNLGDREGHWIMVALEFNDCNYILINVYSKIKRQLIRVFLQNVAALIDDWKNIYCTDKFIIGRVFNAVLD